MKKNLLLFGLSTMALLAGCAGLQNQSAGAGSTPPTAAQSVAGNWMFQATPTSGKSLFTQAAGSLSQAQDDASVTASLVNQSAVHVPCLDANALIPLLGTQAGAELGLQSFAIDTQYINLAAKVSSAGTILTGTYAVHGGCADGATGTLSALQLQPLTGRYTGQTTSTAPIALSLQITQLQAGTGDGRFLTSGTAAITGSPCLAKGALNFPNGYVVGNEMAAILQTDDANGATLMISGAFAADASKIFVSKAEISGGLCTGSLGALELVRVGS